MKPVGIALLVIGLLALAFGFLMDTSVDTGFGDRVHNIGLLQQQQNVVIVGIVLLVLGVVLALLGRKSGAVQTSDTSIAPESHRICPFCAEHIRKDAVICRFCNREVSVAQSSIESPVPVAPSDEEVMAKFGITYDGAQYRFQNYKYDHLADAARYAEKQTVSPN